MLLHTGRGDNLQRILHQLETATESSVYTQQPRVQNQLICNFISLSLSSKSNNIWIFIWNQFEFNQNCIIESVNKSSGTIIALSSILQINRWKCDILNVRFGANSE